jgi:CMP-2-keto-3-deoxyoctulosonic acid synthetase
MKTGTIKNVGNNIPIKIVVTEFESLSVDTPSDLEIARRYYTKIIKSK